MMGGQGTGYITISAFTDTGAVFQCPGELLHGPATSVLRGDAHWKPIKTIDSGLHVTTILFR